MTDILADWVDDSVSVSDQDDRADHDSGDGTRVAGGGAGSWAARGRSARRWFRAFRRTRPFWGGLWLMLGGYWVLHYNAAPIGVIVATGMGGLSGWLIGGGMFVCGLIPWFAPSQRYTVGFMGTVLSVVSLVASNLGGFFLGMAFGILGGTMLLAWGPKRPRARRRSGTE